MTALSAEHSRSRYNDFQNKINLVFSGAIQLGIPIDFDFYTDLRKRVGRMDGNIFFAAVADHMSSVPDRYNAGMLVLMYKAITDAIPPINHFEELSKIRLTADEKEDLVDFAIDHLFMTIDRPNKASQTQRKHYDYISYARSTYQNTMVRAKKEIKRRRLTQVYNLDDIAAYIRAVNAQSGFTERKLLRKFPELKTADIPELLEYIEELSPDIRSDTPYNELTPLLSQERYEEFITSPHFTDDDRLILRTLAEGEKSLRFVTTKIGSNKLKVFKTKEKARRFYASLYGPERQEIEKAIYDTDLTTQERILTTLLLNGGRFEEAVKTAGIGNIDEVFRSIYIKLLKSLDPQFARRYQHLQSALEPLTVFEREGISEYYDQVIRRNVSGREIDYVIVARSLLLTGDMKSRPAAAKRMVKVIKEKVGSYLKTHYGYSQINPLLFRAEDMVQDIFFNAIKITNPNITSEIKW